jgi:rhodanese-related sulfurtransferase
VSEGEETVGVERARELIASNEAQALDIRDSEEWESSHIPGALHIPEAELEGRSEEIPAEGTLIVVCAGGKRSAEVAASLREDRGLDAANIEGGMKAWESEQFPMQPSTDPSAPVEPGEERL